VLSITALSITYPIGAQYNGTSFPFFPTSMSYLILGCLMTVGALVADNLMKKLLLVREISDPVARGFLFFVFVFSALVILGLSFGFGLVDVPKTRIYGIFFAEWQFFRFIGYDAFPLAMTLTVTSWLSNRHAGPMTTKGI